MAALPHYLLTGQPQSIMTSLKPSSDSLKSNPFAFL